MKPAAAMTGKERGVERQVQRTADLEKARAKIVFPLDFSDPAEAAAFAGRLDGHVGLFKVGLELFVTAGPAVLDALPGKTGVFLDLKFHDIPATVRSAARAAAARGVRYVSVHAAGGRKMLEAAVEGAGERTGVLAVTALTSLSREDLTTLGLRDDLTAPEKLVMHRADQAREAGCAGIVCSGQEVGAVKARFGGDFIALVPGVRPQWGDVPRDDQSRVTTPAEAVGLGADYLVVGRPIRLAPDPPGAAERVAEEMASALSRGGAALS
jgi:orotidine-5'-phosphate decarboxylase